MRRSLVGVVVILGMLSLQIVPAAGQDALFFRGDVNQDGFFDISDAVSVLLGLFVPGHPILCEQAADIDDNGDIEITDAIYALDYLFRDRPAPLPPFGTCGEDPTPDNPPLGCDESLCGVVPPSIEVSAACAPGAPGEVAWAITNLEDRSVILEWAITGSTQASTIGIGAEDTIVLTTVKEPGLNELVLSYQGQELATLVQGGVIISEMMASNADSYADKDGDSSDWIEVHVVDSPCGPSTNIGGWYLTDDASNLAKWAFPSLPLRPGDYLLVFASGKDEAVAGQELHTSFKLASEHGYLALVAPDGETIVDEFYPEYPEQLTDVSYGRAQTTTPLVGVGHSVLYRVPTSGDAVVGTDWTDPDYSPSGWISGTTGLGFTNLGTEGFEVTTVRSAIQVGNISTADQVLRNPGSQISSVTVTAPLIDYFNSGGSGNYTNNFPFPGLPAGDQNDFVVYVTGTVLVPQPGQWSFGVNSDDGFSLKITNGFQTFNMSHPDPRGPADTIQAFTLGQPGPYDIELLFFERGGGSHLEFFAAQGSFSSFNSEFKLVGDVASGGLELLGFATHINTDVGSRMRGVNASIWTRATFTVDDPSEFASLLLRTRYEDGYVAFLNGTEVARRNAPATLAWNSAALSDRPVDDIALVHEANITDRLDLLRTGTNVLAVQGLNDTASEGNFLIVPELIAASPLAGIQYMSDPTPGTFNTSGAFDFVRRVEFSVDHGFFDASFSLTLSTATDGAQIRYTLDGSTPTATRGSVYTSPLAVDRTRVIRAAAFKPDYLESSVQTRSYFFASDVIRQSPSGQLPGPGWPSSGVNGQELNYGMDPDIVDNPRWSGLMEDALLAIPTVSLVTDLANLFDPQIGIYVNARQDGRAWERRTSVELIHPDGTEGFALDAGLRIRGAFSRSGGNPKHSFRLFFRSEYGEGKLDYPLFGGEGVDSFDKVDLRTSQNYSWAFGGSSKNTMLREVFSRDAQSEMHEPYTRSRYYHLYLNGHYWGIYQTQERADADFAESYLGGDKSQYDVIKNNSSGGRALQATDGFMDAYWRLYDAAAAGFSTNSAYFQVLGLKPDGTFDPDGEQLLDPVNLMDYMICTYYTGDPDAPVSCWAHFSNNVFAIYNRERKNGFTWYRHDAEHSLGASDGDPNVNEARLLTDPTDRNIGSSQEDFNPAWLHVRLTSHPEYRLQFADRVNKFFSHGGLFTSDPNVDRWMRRAAEIDLAIIAESARWGDSKRSSNPLTKDHWVDQTNRMVGTYFPQRTQIVLNQMRSVSPKMFPDQAIVSFNRHGGEVEPGFQLFMTQSNGTSGTIYYTLDGSDPRLWGGSVNPAAAVFSSDTTGVTFISRGATWKYKDDGSNQGTAWRGRTFSDASWASGPAELGYGDASDGRPEATVVSYGPDEDNKYPTTYFRHKFEVTDASEVLSLSLGVVRDDGAIVYLNGVEAIPRLNMDAGPIDYLDWANGSVGGSDESTLYSFDVDPGLLVDGDNVVAVEIHQRNGQSSDISFDLQLTGSVAGDGSPPVTIDETTTVRARVYGAGGWGAMTSARFTVGLEGLVINEFMASNATVLEDPAEPGEYPDWVEFYNGTAGTITLSGMYLTDDLQNLTHWQIGPGVTIDSGEHVIIYADDDGTQGSVHTNYQLSASGEGIALVDTDGETIIDVIVFDKQTTDVSYGRYPDGSDTWGFHQSPTPGSTNTSHAP